MERGWGALRDYAGRTGNAILLPFIVSKFVPVFFQLCSLNDGFTPSVTSDEERVEEIHWWVVVCTAVGVEGVTELVFR